MEYSVRARGRAGVRVRLSTPGPALDGDRYWLEIVAAGSEGLPFAARLLVRGGPSRQLERVLLYPSGQAPLEVPLSDLREGLENQPPTTSNTVKHVQGMRPVKVPAGSFRAEELRVIARGEVVRVWRSAEIPLWGLVRARGRRQDVELIGYGQEGARTVFPASSDGRIGKDHGKGSESAK